MVEASFTGLFRTVLIIIGVFVVVRFLGQLMNTKRNLSEQEQMKSQDEELKSERERMARNFGKTTIIDKGRNTSGDVEDVDFEEIKD